MTESEKAKKVPQILVVDDHEQNVELLNAFLTSEGYEVLTASDGDEALKKAYDEEIDLILLDIMMPHLDGFEVCKRLKADEKKKDIPIIMITAYDEMENIEKGVDVGTDDFLSKPINRLELLTRVKSLLRVKHLKGELDRLVEYLKSIKQ